MGALLKALLFQAGQDFLMRDYWFITTFSDDCQIVEVFQ